MIRNHPTRGTLTSSGLCRTIAIQFENEIFERIATEAFDNGRSFREQVLIYLGRGIDAVGRD